MFSKVYNRLVTISNTKIAAKTKMAAKFKMVATEMESRPNRFIHGVEGELTVVSYLFPVKQEGRQSSSAIMQSPIMELLQHKKHNKIL